MEATLGTETDAAIAARLGLTRDQVKMHRIQKGIRPANPKAPKYADPNTATAGVATLTAHLSAQTRNKVAALQPKLLDIFRATGLPLRAVSMWQVVEYAVDQLHSRLLVGDRE